MAESNKQVVERALRAALKEQLNQHATANSRFLPHYLGAAMEFWLVERGSGRTESMKQQAFEDRIESLGRMLREPGAQP